MKISVSGMGCAIDLFEQADFADDCEDASLKEVIRYLHGCRGLRIPEEWRHVLPTHL